VEGFGRAKRDVRKALNERKGSCIGAESCMGYHPGDHGLLEVHLRSWVDPLGCRRMGRLQLYLLSFDRREISFANYDAQSFV
jgi:hypothetical protein